MNKMHGRRRRCYGPRHALATRCLVPLTAAKIPHRRKDTDASMFVRMPPDARTITSTHVYPRKPRIKQNRKRAPRPTQATESPRLVLVANKVPLRPPPVLRQRAVPPEQIRRRRPEVALRARPSRSRPNVMAPARFWRSPNAAQVRAWPATGRAHAAFWHSTEQ